MRKEKTSVRRKKGKRSTRLIVKNRKSAQSEENATLEVFGFTFYQKKAASNLLHARAREVQRKGGWDLGGKKRKKGVKGVAGRETNALIRKVLKGEGKGRYDGGGQKNKRKVEISCGEKKKG